MQRIFSHNEHGITLLEVMMAGVILTIGMMAVASGQIQSVSMSKERIVTLRGVAAAESMLEMIRMNRDHILNYGVFDTDLEATSTKIAGLDSASKADFVVFQAAIRAIAPLTPYDKLQPGMCGVPQVGDNHQRVTITTGAGGQSIPHACGSILVQPGVMPGTNTVAINVAWPAVFPGRPNGISLVTTVGGTSG